MKGIINAGISLNKKDKNILNSLKMMLIHIQFNGKEIK